MSKKEIVVSQCTFTAKLRFSFFRSAFLVFHLPDQLLLFRFSAFLLFCFSAFLLFCFSAFLLFCFSAFLLFCFSAFLLFCFSAFLLFCFSAFLLFQLFRFSHFPPFSFSAFQLISHQWLWHAAPWSLSHLSFSNQLLLLFLILCLHYLILIYMGYFDYLFYIEEGGQKSPPPRSNSGSWLLIITIILPWGINSSNLAKYFMTS